MITADEMMNKVGKQKFIEMAVNSQRGVTGAQIQHKRRFGTNIKHKMCEHGNWVIENYEPKKCKECFEEVDTKLPDFKPNFNIGLGCWVESRSDEKRAAKRLGLVEAG